MALYAILDGNRVKDLVSPPDGAPLESLSHLTPAQIKNSVPVPAGIHISVGWAHSEGRFLPPDRVKEPLSLSQQAAAILGNGLAIISASDPKLNGIYPTDISTRTNAQSELISLILRDSFLANKDVISVLDVKKTVHVFDRKQFKSMFFALEGFAASLRTIIATNDGKLPSLPIEIE